MFSIRRADVSDIPAIQAIAHRTWPSAYGQILSRTQIQYMLQTMYSDHTLQQSFAGGDFYYFIYLNHDIVGFAGFGIVDDQQYKLHKLYILPEGQGSGAGKALLQFVIRKAASLGAHSLWLNVNRYNKAKSFYERMGFSVAGEKKTDIGEGYIMDDFVMKLPL